MRPFAWFVWAYLAVLAQAAASMLLIAGRASSTRDAPDVRGPNPVGGRASASPAPRSLP